MNRVNPFTGGAFSPTLHRTHAKYMLNSRTRNAFRECISTFKAHPRLAWYPLLSTFLCLAVSAAILLPTRDFDFLREVRFGWRRTRIPIGTGVVCVALFFANHFITSFFSASLSSTCLRLLRGKEATFGDGVRMATRRLPSLTVWVLISGTVGWILRGASGGFSLFERRSTVVTPLSFLGDTLWHLATLFVVPAIIVGDASTFDALKHSIDTFKRRWGESTYGFFGFGFFFGLVAVPGPILASLGLWIGSTAGTVLLVAGLAWVVVTGVVYKTLETIWTTALYLYARTGKAPVGFDDEKLQDTFRGEPAY